MHQYHLGSLLTKQLPGLHFQTLWHNGTAVGLKTWFSNKLQVDFEVLVCSHGEGLLEATLEKGTLGSCQMSGYLPFMGPLSPGHCQELPQLLRAVLYSSSPIPTGA